jgi:uncharacterized protein (TIGR02452 family)
MWDSIAFVQKMAEATRNRDYALRSALRVSVFADTVACVRDRSCETGKGPRALDLSDTMAERSVLYDRPFSPTCENRFDTVVTVTEGDCLASARRLGNDTLVLNMANAHTPGGGVEHGSGAQEEHLFRSSDYFRSLYRFHSEHARRYGLSPDRKQYPLDSRYGAVYTPDVTVFRGPEDEGYPYLAEPFRICIVAVPAINHPELETDGSGNLVLAPDATELTKEKIRTLFRVAIAHGHRNLVLSAFGCGAFANPPAHMATLFHRTLREPPFCHAFERIDFAIKEDRNSHKGHNRQGNYLPFATEFEKGSI